MSGRLTTHDFNGDGDADVLWRDSSGNVGIRLMNGATIASIVSDGNAGTNWAVQSLNAD